MMMMRVLLLQMLMMAYTYDTPMLFIKAHHDSFPKRHLLFQIVSCLFSFEVKQLHLGKIEWIGSCRKTLGFTVGSMQGS